MMNREDAAIAAAIAAVEEANDAAALVDTVAASGAVCGSEAKAMDAAIYDFAASILHFIISQNHLQRTSGLSSSCFFSRQNLIGRFGKKRSYLAEQLASRTLKPYAIRLIPLLRGFLFWRKYFKRCTYGRCLLL